MAKTGYVDIEQGVSAKNSGYEWIIICIIKIQNPKFLQYAPPPIPSALSVFSALSRIGMPSAKEQRMQ